MNMLQLVGITIGILAVLCHPHPDVYKTRPLGWYRMKMFSAAGLVVGGALMLIGVVVNWLN